MLIVLLAATCGVLTFIFFMLLFAAARRAQSVDIFYRLRRHYVDKSTHFKKTEDFLRRVYSFIKRVAKPIEKYHISQKLDFRLKQAGIPIFGGEFIILSIVGSIAGFIFTYIATLNINFAMLAMVGMPLGFWIWLSMRLDRRRQAFTEQLGDCLTTVANALRAGYSFQQAMDVVAREMEPPISTEFERVMTDMAMGVALETALEQMNKRIGSSDFDLVVTAVLIQREVGGNLAQILDTISDTINERIRMKREIKALTAQGRFSAWVLVALPFVVAVFCWFFNNEQMRMFITEESGRIALGIAVVMEIVGFVIIQKIVDIEV